MNGTGHDAEEDPVRGEITHSVTRAYITSSSKSYTSSTVKFEALNISSELVPTLQKIWLKHGNIMEDIVIRNGDIVARTLESLATAVQILEGNTCRSLNDCQAGYLRSMLSDLQLGLFKVDWLVAFIENALAHHKSKPTLETLAQCKARAAEMRTKLLDDLAKVDELEKELEVEMTMVTHNITFSGELEFDNPLGGGLT